MKSVAPVSRVYEVEDMIKAGADELYCGVYTKEWRRRYSDIAAPNRHPGSSANLADFTELSRVVDLAHSRSTPVFFAINEFYAARQCAAALDNIKEAIDAGVDALIISDINLLLMVREGGHNIKIHMGTGGTTFNSRTVAFYKGLGVSRVILDRQLRIGEIAAVASRSRDIELEVFALNQRCHNIDGFCAFAHGLTAARHPLLAGFWNTKLIKRLLNLYPADAAAIVESIFRQELGCCLGYTVSGAGSGLDADKKEKLRKFFDAGIFLKRCGACALYDLDNLKVGFVKIVGREDFTAKKIRDVRFIHEAIGLLGGRPRKESFVERIKALYRNVYFSDCASRFCYYADILQDGEGGLYYEDIRSQRAA